MKTNKQVSVAVISTLLAGTCFAVGSAWSQSDSRLRQGAPAGTPLNPGSLDPERVKQIQQALKDKGFDPGPIDGMDGAKTRDAIRAFQKKNNLHVTAGKSPDDETLRALGIGQ